MLIGLTTLAFSQAANLNGVTFGFGAGYNVSLDKTYDYSLTTDASHNLKIQPLNKGSFVISSVVMIKLSKVAFDSDNNKFVKQSQRPTYNKLVKSPDEGDKKKVSKDKSWSNIMDHLSINLALDLANVTQNVSFNKNISGGLGIGYFFTDYVQAAVFYDISRVSQLRDYVVANYADKPIPNGTTGNYTSLSTSDNNLFYNKTVSGLTFKLIFSLANKKAE